MTRKELDYLLKKNINQYSKYSAHLADVVKSDSKYYFYDENENHIETNGPKGFKIVQYFACQKLKEMIPSKRFQWLRKKDITFSVHFLVPIMMKANISAENAK